VTGRQGHVHEALVAMSGPEGDSAAPGAAITVALCGHWDHEPPCPLAPHHTTASPAGETVLIRTVFVAERDDVAKARRRIEAAIRRGNITGPDGRETSWGLVRPGAVEAGPGDDELIRRLREDGPGSGH
jgi:hypothetical protein